MSWQDSTHDASVHAAQLFEATSSDEFGRLWQDACNALAHLGAYLTDREVPFPVAASQLHAVANAVNMSALGLEP